MYLNKIIDEYTEIVNKYEAKEAVDKIMRSLCDYTGNEKVARIEALAWLAVISRKQAHFAQAKLDALMREIGA